MAPRSDKLDAANNQQEIGHRKRESNYAQSCTVTISFSGGGHRLHSHHCEHGAGAHGLNERIRVKSLMNGRRFLYEMVNLYANGAD
jgi:acetylornithine deacetylase/succinyl-diaminopimelate desuccinylase-like protein